MTMNHRSWLLPSVLVACTLPLLLSACGSGTAAIVAGSGGSDGGTTVQPAISAFRIDFPTRPDQASLHFVLSKEATIHLVYRLPGDLATDAPRSMTQAGAPNPRDFAAGEHDIPWNFAGEEGLEAIPGASFHRDVLVYAIIPGVQEQPTQDANARTLGLGNDPPVVHAALPMPTDPEDPEESAGNVEIRLQISDTSSDPVNVLVQWRRASAAPDAWMDAMTTGVFPDGVETTPAPGVQLSFFWNTNLDLADEESTVFFRVTADDRTAVGEAFVTQAPFRIDNNEEPIVQLLNDQTITNPDERRGIPIPFRALDEEGDMVELVFQWRRPGQPFPSLDTDGDARVTNAEIEAILADPLLRLERQVATSYPSFARGRVVPLDATTVRLPELTASESWILAFGVEGRALELMRPSSIPEPITPTWAESPLAAPVAALPFGDGLTVLVLDAPGTGRLREVELATGVVVREIATFGQGAPSTMTLERGERAVLVALEDGGSWRIERVELASGASVELASGGTEPGPVRGLASLGSEAAVFTAGSSLFLLDYCDPLVPSFGGIVVDLATPWGVVVDPQSPDRVFVGERDADRILAIELDSHRKLPVVVKTLDMQPGTLDGPEALALEQQGTRLLIVTAAAGGGSQLVGLGLGAQAGNATFPIGAPHPGEIGSVASGPDGLRLVSLRTEDELLVAGGLEQRRTIQAFEPQSPAEPREGRAVVTPPFVPQARPGQPWRIREGGPLLASPQGAVGRFVWDSTDAHTGPVFLRALARDAEVGVISDGGAPKSVLGSLDVPLLVVDDLEKKSRPVSVAVADLDGDGDLDLVSANERGDSLTVFHQETPGLFAPSPEVLGGFPITIAPVSVAAADLDGDGDQDLVSANREEDSDNGSNLTVFFQAAPGSFEEPPLVLGGPDVTDTPFSVAAADLDGDGDQDLVSANRFSDNLTIFTQESPGSFATTPPLGEFPTTIGPVAVAVADLNGDGALDLVSANRDEDSGDGSNLTVFFQVSPGSFAEPPLVLGGPDTTVTPVSVAAADLDGDGDQDLVSANEDGDDLTVFLQGSPGSYGATPSRVLGGPGTTDSPLSVAAADLDGDGDQDLVSANGDEDLSGFGGNRLTVFFQGSPGSFGSTPLIVSGSRALVLPRSVTAADLDGDGDQDLVSADEFAGKLAVFLQLSRGSFGANPLALGGFATTISPSSVAAGDLDGDGDPDLVSANENGNDLTVFFQASPGIFGEMPMVLDGDEIDGPSSVAAADLDGDGRLDLASANRFSDNLSVFFQESSGSFAPSPQDLGVSTTNGPSSIVAADLDGDGGLDLVTANRGGNDLTVFFQRSPGVFAEPPMPLGGDGLTEFPLSLVAADLDGDGGLDLVSANGTGNNLTVFFQRPPGKFEPTPLVLRGPVFPSSVAAADLDVDGDQDLAAANLANLTVFFQLSPRSFETTPSLVISNSSEVVATSDLDGDGDLDLVSTDGDALTIFFQHSPGGFGATPLVLGDFQTTVSPVSILPGDLDGDGDEDLVSANSDGDNLTVFFGGR